MKGNKKDKNIKLSFAYPALLSSERIIFKTRPHWLTVVFPEVVFVILGIFITKYLSNLPHHMLGENLFTLLFLPSWSFAMTVILLDWICTSYCLTNLRLVKERGVIGMRLVSISLDRVQDETCKFGFWGQIFGFGDIEIESAGTYGKITFRFIPYPLKRWEEIERAIRLFKLNDF
jgi:uncharacterized membrane protein YdbT with pleckstrin-like domain